MKKLGVLLMGMSLLTLAIILTIDDLIFVVREGNFYISKLVYILVGFVFFMGVGCIIEGFLREKNR